MGLFSRRAARRMSWRRKPFASPRYLLTTLDVVFMDTTSLYFEGAGGQTLGRGGSRSITGPTSTR